MKTIYLTIIISCFIIFSIQTSARAQWYSLSNKPLSPAKMCHKINKNRVRKARKKVRLKKAENNITRISYKPYEISHSRPGLKSAPSAKDEILHVPELIASKGTVKPLENDLPVPINSRQMEIRKKVADQIERGQANEPILESLYFITDEAEFAYVDFDPFLLAVEYALQGKMVLVEGYTDNRGGEEHNLQLSMKRVRQIEALMHDIGVAPENVSVIGYGEANPKYDNATEEGRQKNRRVDFKIF
ncbi:MAG: OmpA family protein [Cyclobacteriaceae bacterium]|nr:OmpA family protein [Cyclobacteriaceae bacterium]